MAEYFKLQTTSGEVHGEMRLGSPMVVFSHGFGVKRDSRGMFTDIAKAVPKDWGYILFDHNTIAGDNVTLAPYSIQQEKLNTVLVFAQSQAETIYLIGHSMGAITASLLASSVPTKVILLTPPVHGPRLKSNNSWAERPGAYYDGDTLIVPRKDGTTSIIPNAFFEEASKVDCIEAIKTYAKSSSCVVIEALEEDIITNLEGYGVLEKAGVTVTKIHGNHNFDSPDRQRLIDEILAILGT